MFEYNFLPVPVPSKRAKGRKTTPERMAHALCEALNEQAREGWEFTGQEHFTCDEKSGLMGKEKHLELRYLVFRREVRIESMPLDQKLEKMREIKAETIAATPPPPSLEPFPKPMPSPQTSVKPMSESRLDNGEEPTRIFSPIDHDLPESSDAPALGPAEKNNQI